MARVAAVQEEMKAAGAWVFFAALTDQCELKKARVAIGGAAGSAASRVRRLPAQDRGFAS
jgi:hypothetical protein